MKQELSVPIFKTSCGQWDLKLRVKNSCNDLTFKFKDISSLSFIFQSFFTTGRTVYKIYHGVFHTFHVQSINVL